MGKRYTSYTLKVDLFDQKVSHRLEVPGGSTLEELHEMIQAAFEFDNDHLYGFFMDNQPFSDDAYYVPGYDAGRCADQVTLDELTLIPGARFLYIFDFGEEWRFAVEIQKVERVDHKPIPIILDSGGPNPDQYQEGLEDYDDGLDLDHLEISTIQECRQPLSSSLKELYKDELKELCKLFCIESRSSWNKTQLAEALIQSWTQEPESMLRVYSQDEITYLLDIWESNHEAFMETRMDTLLMFEDQGLVRLEMDDEFIDLQYIEEGKEIFETYLKSREGEAKRNWYAEIEALTMGYMWCYGIIERDQLFPKIRRYMNSELSDEHFQLFLWQRYLWDQSMHLYLDQDTGVTYISFIEGEAMDRQVLEERGKRQLDYREFTKKEILDYYYTAGLGPLEQVRDFYQYMVETVFQDEEDAHAFIAMSLGLLKGGAVLSDIVEELVPPAAEIGAKQRKQTIHFLQNIQAAIPDFRFKGHTPNEVRVLESNLQVICGGQAAKKK